MDGIGGRARLGRDVGEMPLEVFERAPVDGGGHRLKPDETVGGAAEKPAELDDVVDGRLGVAALPSAVADVGEVELPRHVALREAPPLPQFLQAFCKLAITFHSRFP